MNADTRVTVRKLALSACVLGAAAAVAGLGTFGTFTSTTSASEQASSGTVVIALGASGVDNRLSVTATGLVPGDTVQRALKLLDNGTQDLSSVVLTTAATTSSKLDTDTTSGLQLTIQSCATNWTEAGTAPAYTYTCPGAATTVLASRPVIGTNMALTGLLALTAGASDHLVITLTFPAPADNTFQNQSSTIGFTFTGTQRVATNR